MDFNTKLRIIGFYNKPNQDMKPEDCFVEEANTMASLLSISFSSLLNNEETDTFFKGFIEGNSVFILKNEDNWLLAYYPKKQLVRISNVIFNKKHINSVPFKYKSWFVPGCPIEVKTTSKYKVSTRGKDYFISYNGKELPLKWNLSYISVKDLYKLLECKYTELSEYKTIEVCNHCDGYDYRYCDEDRCRKEHEYDNEACEGCGGRRYKCTEEKCFNKRYDNAYVINLNQSEVDSLQFKIKEILGKLSSPNCQDIEGVLSKNKLIIDEFVSIRNYLYTYGWELDVWDAYIEYKKLQEFRDSKDQIEWILVETDTISYKVCVDGIYIKRSGLFFVDYYLKTVEKTLECEDDCNCIIREEGKTYDSISDSFVEFSFPLCFSSKKLRDLFIDSMSSKKVSKIELVKNNENEFLVKCFGIRK